VTAAEPVPAPAGRPARAARPAGRRRQRVLVYGSCVSRDSFEAFDAARFVLHGYHARHSLISAFSPLPADVVATTALPSAFQRRMVTDDVTAALVGRLTSAARPPDLILWDLVDERLGVVELPGGGALTVSNELLAARVELPEGSVHVPFGSDRHFELWTGALARFADLLGCRGLSGRTVLLLAPWASRTHDGRPTPPSHGVAADEGNLLYARYEEAAAALPGVRVVRMSPAEAVGAAEHRWGPAPFHYTDDFYRLVAARVADAVTAPAAAPAPPAGAPRGPA
jgi:hypothetical protein